MSKLFDNLPYKIQELESKGEYAYIMRRETKKKPSTRTLLKVVRTLTLCDGPRVWEKIAEGNELPVFVQRLRIFCTPDIIEDYLNSPEYKEYQTSHNLPLETVDSVKSDIITDKNYEEYETVILKEYSSSIERNEVSLSDIENTLNLVKKTAKGKGEKNLKTQYSKILSCPSKVIDVSNFGKTMDKKYGRILDRVRDKARISKCKSINSTFPIISDNIHGFERAMNTLGPEFMKYISQFNECQNETIGAVVS